MSSLQGTFLNLTGYIDAGTGSYLLAAIAGGAAGVWFFIRSSIARLRGRKFDDAAPDDKSDSPEG